MPKTCLSPASLFRGRELTHEKVYFTWLWMVAKYLVKLVIPFWASAETLEKLYLPRSDPRSRAVVELAERLVSVIGYKASQCVGTLCQRQMD